MRLDKFLAEAGIGTRKSVRDFIKEGLVNVNGQTVYEAATLIEEEKDIIEYCNKKIDKKEKVYYMFNKPAGCITARKDEEHKTVLDFFQEEDMNGIFHVGRLDKDTEGILLFTNDGEFEHHLMCPQSHVEKKYFFVALGDLKTEDIFKLRNGLSIGENEPLTKPAKVEIIKRGLYEEFLNEMDISSYYEKKSSMYSQHVISGYLVISEGRKHQVKRMLKSVGCYVIYLKRISIGKVHLDPKLKKGQYRKLSIEEVKILKT